MSDFEILKNSEMTSKIIRYATKSLTDVPLSLSAIPEFKCDAELSTFGKMILTNYNQQNTSIDLETKTVEV